MTKPVFSWVFWVPFILIFASINTHFSWSKCLEDQQSLLLQLRQTLIISPSKSPKLATWNQTSDCCQWGGVQCNVSTGQVVGLDLCGESISGGIDNSSSLFGLEFLRSLNLANNSFGSAQIPSAFAKLSGLSYLNLSNAGFSGQVPIEISQLIKLEILDLSSNAYLGFSPTILRHPNLGMLIRNLSNIRELHLDGVTITDNGSELWKALASSVPKLQVLSLSNCDITGEIDPSLVKLYSLSEIILAQNTFSTSVPEFLTKFRNLTVLKLSSCQLTGTVPPGILSNPTLRVLDLSYNRALQGTLPEFPENSSLQNLILSYTNFYGQLPNSIGNLKQLNRMEIQNSSFSGFIPSSMAGLMHVVHVDISVNSFSGPIPSFSAAKNLTYLNLGKNMLNGTLQSTEWRNLTNLVSLDLSYNSLSGNIPMHLFCLPSLQQLLLQQNGFGGKLEESSFRKPFILDTLDLSNNNLQGSIPKSLFEVKGLKILKLSSNNFSGSLKLNLIQKLKNLSTLDLSYNNLAVDANSRRKLSSFPQLSELKLASCELHVLPDFLKNQSKLFVLDLSDNHIQGTLPNWIWTIGNGTLSFLNLSSNKFEDFERPLPDTPALSILDIHMNNFQGEVPILSSSAIYLDYSSNSFTSIHSDISNSLSYAIFFSLSRNNISGSIPMAFCNATALQVLDLSTNSLSGTVPDCIIKMMTRTLGVLNLWSNSLKGSIPDLFPEDCSLITIDFGENNLQGQLPRSLAKCKDLEVLNLGRNQLHDTFPSWWMNLSHLRVLVLRGNKLYGSISCPPSNTIWSMLQIIDLASNRFNGILEAQCLVKLTALMAVTKDERFSVSELQFPVLTLDKLYYQDMVVVTTKGNEVMLQKILNVFTCIDLSSNEFSGTIPEVMGDLSELVVLNLSHNALSGSIPPSIGKLFSLESLDLSCNNLHGNIPDQLAGLVFLEVLNFSYNRLTGSIPQGNQLQTFDNSSYLGNMGLCGSPLQKCSTKDAQAPPVVPSATKRKSGPRTGLDWQLILIGSGFGTGAALVIAPFLFWKKGRKWYEKQVEKVATAILDPFGVIGYTNLDEETLGPEEGTGHQLFDINSYDEDDDDDTEDEQDSGRFCVFCTKLDIERKRVIHNPGCTCHGSPSISSCTSTSSSK